MKLTSAILLCTKNRTEEVRRFLKSIRTQSRRPDEVLVIDGAAREDVKSIAADFTDLSLRYLTVAGDLTVARNLGVRESHADIVFFLDDDLVLNPTFIEEIMRVFESDESGSIGGVCGTIHGYHRTRGFRALMNRLFFMPGDGNGKFKPSGAPGWVYAERESRDVEFLPGGLTAYRRRVFQHDVFDEALPNFGYTDDVDFSFRVSRRFKNRYCPTAVAEHVQPPSERAMSVEVLKTWIWAYWRTYWKNRRQDWTGYPALFALTIGYGLRFLDSLWRSRPTSLVAFALAVFLIPMFAFNKAFAYTRIWLGSVPVFITEILLAGMAVVWIGVSWKRRRVLAPRDWPFWLCVALLFMPGLLSWAELPGRGVSEIIDAAKRSALFYYAAFAIFLYCLAMPKKTIELILVWTLIGAVGASFIDVIRPFSWSPKTWPVSVGIARETARAVVALFILFALPARYRNWGFAFLGAFMLAMIATTVRRSALLTFVVVVGAIILTLILRPLSHEERRWVAKVALIAVPMIFLHVSLFGIPQSITRFQFLEALVRKKPSPNLSPASKPSVLPSGLVVKKDEHPSPHTPTPVPPSAARVVAPTPSPEIRSPSPQNYVEIFKKRLFKGLLKGAGGGNVGWRGKVWLEGLKKGVVYHLWLGAGVASPFIAESVSPYKDPERLNEAISILSRKVNFSSRMASESDPSQNLRAIVPLDLRADEGSGLVSHYWYNVDFHNSHIAIFYRFGLVGFLGYAGLIFVLFFRLLWALRLTGDGLYRFLMLVLIWYISVATFNVALEGPFLGAVFWIFVGFGFCSVSTLTPLSKPARNFLALSPSISESSLPVRH